jgi:hypothetical protein
MNGSFKVGLLTVFSLTFAGAAFGNSFTTSCSIGPQTADFNNTPLACGQIDTTDPGPTQGATINDIIITIDGSDTGGISLTNVSGATDPTLSGTYTTTYGLNAALAGFAFPSPLFTVVMSVSGTNVPTGATVSNLALSATNTNGGIEDTTPATFGAYTGAGTFNIFINSPTTLAIAPGTGTLINAGTSDMVAATATVEFDYTPANTTSTAPEPGTALLLGIGTVCVLFGSRRRKA